MKLRDYQQECSDTAINHLKKSIAPILIEAATGAGKSLIVAEIARWISEVAPAKKVLCLAPSKELVEQNHEKYLMTGNSASIFCASAGGKCLKHRVIFCSPLTTANHINEIAKMQVSAIIIDEAHSITPTVLNIIDAVRACNQNARIIGLTATPYRMNTGYIYAVDEWGDAVHETKAKDPFFSRLVYRVTAPYLIDRGYLTPPRLIDISKSYDTKTLKLNKLNRFDDDELERIFSDKSVTEVIIDLIIEQSAISKGVLIFATTIKHAQDILSLLPVGDCRLVTGATPKKEREEIIAMFKAKMFKYLVNVAVLTTGFDAPHVDFVAVLRPTESRGLFQQIIGRGTRLHDDKEFFVVCDCAGNIERHGLQDDLFNPELADVAKDSDAIAEDVDCPVCGFVNQNKWIEIKGKMISTLRRCKAVYPIEGIENPTLKKHFYRCSHYFKFKECPECGSENDITARVCKKCRYQIIKPDEKLKLGSKSTTFQHDIESFEILPHHSHAGHDGFKAIINGKYTKYFATHTKRGLAEYEKCTELQPKQIIISTGGKYPDIRLVW